MTQVALDTSMGLIKIKVDDENAPNTVENFLSYARDGHYDGTIFHRVIQNFMVQGGGFTDGFSQKPTRDSIKNEATNGLKNNRYTVAMARTSDPHSATAQFFINTADNDFLNHGGQSPSSWGYAVFGKVVEGIDVVQRIAAVPTGNQNGMQDVPKETVTINSATVIEE